MGAIIRFFIRHHFFVLFLLLELVSILLLVNLNRYHSAVAFKFANETRGSLFSVMADFSGYVGLKAENDRLQQQNTLLLNKLKTGYAITDTLFFDSTLTTQKRFQYTTAEVISNSTNRKNNYLMLNKGVKNGVAPEMGVIGPDGVIGVVVKCSDNYAKVMPLLHRAALISAKIKGSNNMGPVVWDQLDPRYARLKDIPQHANFKVGDTVVTSGYSFIFPENIAVGTITSFNRNSMQNSYDIILLLATDFNALKNVYVVNNMMRKEQDSLFLMDE